MHFHHILTLIVLMFSYRYNFIRIGIIVLFLHDFTDVFIDFIRIFTAVKFKVGLYAVTGLTVLVWPYFRIYNFYNLVIRPIIENEDMYVKYEGIGVPTQDVKKGFAIYLIPLLGILMMNVGWWFEILAKIKAELWTPSMSTNAAETVGSTEYEVERILEKRVNKSYVEYKVHWKNYPASEATWEPASNLKNNIAVEEFHQQRKSRSPSKSRNRSRSKSRRK
ncbi:hypothetical protein TL16_g00511 [Triparma laevis f. inornata]|uniref:Uncharacterized protein n=2 Tax=Triparma laevis TaxID=1534972 RepID=A0A9W7DW49_9STRA|nr:hypothetical protein TL16_g00511 [Triparma laevis f. inornata]GMH56375.1 hypothetical protein TrLO_g10335 [Triparma laevis f. longispina]